MTCWPCGWLRASGTPASGFGSNVVSQIAKKKLNKTGEKTWSHWMTWRRERTTRQRMIAHVIALRAKLAPVSAVYSSQSQLSSVMTSLCNSVSKCATSVQYWPAKPSMLIFPISLSCQLCSRSHPILDERPQQSGSEPGTNGMIQYQRLCNQPFDQLNSQPCRIGKSVTKVLFIIPFQIFRPFIALYCTETLRVWGREGNHRKQA